MCECACVQELGEDHEKERSPVGDILSMGDYLTISESVKKSNRQNTIAFL